MKKQTFGKTALSLAIALSVGAITSNAMAQNSVVAKNGLLTEKTTIVNGSLVEIGTAQKGLSNLKGFAKDLPLIAVLKQITPNEWIVKKAKGKNLDLQKQVSWTGGKNWVETLKDVVENNKIDAVINWDKKEVVLSEVEVKQAVVEQVVSPVAPTQTVSTVATAKPTGSIGVFELSTDVVTQGNSGQVVREEVAPVVNVPVVKSWGFEGKDNLKDVVLSWGKAAGYKVVYTGENYPIDKEDPRVLQGDFDAEEGPIKQLSIDYGPQSRVKKPLSFIFFQNRTLVVEDLRYEQGSYPQYIQK